MGHHRDKQQNALNKVRPLIIRLCIDRQAEIERCASSRLTSSGQHDADITCILEHRLGWKARSAHWITLAPLLD